MKFYKVKDMETMVVAINDNGEKVALIVRSDEAVKKEVVFAARKTTFQTSGSSFATATMNRRNF